MKRWYIEHNGEWAICSLQSLAGSSKIANFKGDNENGYVFQFMKVYDFARSKDGSQQNGWCHISGVDKKSRCNIIFK